MAKIQAKLNCYFSVVKASKVMQNCYNVDHNIQKW